MVKLYCRLPWGATLPSVSTAGSTIINPAGEGDGSYFVTDDALRGRRVRCLLTEPAVLFGAIAWSMAKRVAIFLTLV